MPKEPSQVPYTLPATPLALTFVKNLAILPGSFATPCITISWL